MEISDLLFPEPFHFLKFCGVGLSQASYAILRVLLLRSGIFDWHAEAPFVHPDALRLLKATCHTADAAPACAAEHPLLLLLP